MQKTILVTGSTDGIGKKTAEILASKGHNLIIHGRNENKCKNTVEELKTKTNNTQIDYVVSDLSSFSDIRNGFGNLATKLDKLDVLINNAGIYAKEYKLTVDGIESTMAVNHFAVYLLTGILFPLLKNSGNARVITVSSIAHERAKLDLNDINMQKGYNHYIAYANSKLANILFSNYLASKVDANEITFNSLHPGVISTKLLKEGFGMTGASLEEGSTASIHLATSDSVNNITGKYYIKYNATKTSADASNLKLAEELWVLSEKLTNFKYPL